MPAESGPNVAAGCQPADSSAVTFGVAALSTTPTNFAATVMRKQPVPALDEPVELRLGTYGVERVYLQAPAEDGAIWTFTFERRAGVDAFEVCEPSMSADLLGALSLTIGSPAEAAPGASVPLSVGVRSETGLAMSTCGGEMAAINLGQPQIVGALLGPDGAAVASALPFVYG